MNQKQTTTLTFIVTTSIALMLSGCATPVSVKHVDIPTAYRIQTASAISSGEPSNASSIVLRQHGLLDRFETEPAVVLAELHKGLEPVGDDDQLFALAELSLLHAQQTNDRAYYLASAVYAWSLLYPGDGKSIRYRQRIRDSGLPMIFTIRPLPKVWLHTVTRKKTKCV